MALAVDDREEFALKSSEWKSTKWFCVFDFPKVNGKIDTSFIYDFRKLEMFCEYYVAIYHNKDFKEEPMEFTNTSLPVKVDGRTLVNTIPVTPHYHVLVTGLTQCRLKSVLKNFSQLYKVPITCISAKPANSLPLCIQYMLHVLSNDKTLYKVDDLITNNQAFLSKNLISSDSVLTNYLINLIIECDGSRFQVVEKIGVKMYEKYFRTINSLCKEVSDLRRGLQ